MRPAPLSPKRSCPRRCPQPPPVSGMIPFLGLRAGSRGMTGVSKQDARNPLHRAAAYDLYSAVIVYCRSDGDDDAADGEFNAADDEEIDEEEVSIKLPTYRPPICCFSHPKPSPMLPSPPGLQLGGREEVGLHFFRQGAYRRGCRPQASRNPGRRQRRGIRGELHGSLWQRLRGGDGRPRKTRESCARGQVACALFFLRREACAVGPVGRRRRKL